MPGSWGTELLTSAGRLGPCLTSGWGWIASWLDGSIAWRPSARPRLAAGRRDKRAAEEGAVAEALGYDVLDAGDVAAAVARSPEFPS